MWSVEDSKFIFGLERGDLYYLTVDKEGRLCIRFGRMHIPLPDLIDRVRRQAGEDASSFTLRLPQMITHRIKWLQKKFDEVSKETGFNGLHIPLYPIKVNQQYDCIMTILDSDPTYGLEAGSKAEFILVRDAVGVDKSRLLVCNGGKDVEYIRLVKDAHDRGYKVMLSIESIDEARLIASEIPDGGVPLALRIKPYVHTSGHWAHSAGRDSKFGLSVEDLATVLEILRETKHLDDIITIHAHVGSQLEDLTLIEEFVRFMIEAFVWLREQGLTSLEHIDYGGGLPIDYKALRETPAIDEYITTLVRSVVKFAEEYGLKKHPHIMTEAGRAITAHSSLIVVDIVDVRNTTHSGDNIESLLGDERKKWEAMVKKARNRDDLEEIRETLTKEFETATGEIPLLVRREALYGYVKRLIRTRLFEDDFDRSDCEKIIEWATHPDTIAIGNFSLFNSAMDHVLVDQYFPVIPVDNLHRQPATTIRLVDITCDSDGEISNFVRRTGDGRKLFTEDGRPLTDDVAKVVTGIPTMDPKKLVNSFMVIALTGAYQDILEADHNLFGDLPDVVLTITKEGTAKIVYQRRAESISSILKNVGFLNGDSFDPYFNI